MGLQQSKGQLLYEQVNYGNVEGIKSLRNQGAALEWVDKDGKTPLILACLRHDLLNVAKVLIELGANVNAYRPGSHAGTPLHHAAKKGLEQTVNLLLAYGANPFIMNDDCCTALDLAREKGHINVVRAIESRICLFCGWLRENYGPGFLEALAPQLMSRKVWAVVLPCDSRSPSRPLKFELAVYPDLSAPKPNKVIPLSKCHLEEPKFNQADPSLIIIEKSTRTKHKFLSANEGDKRQLQSFCIACKGLTQIPTVVPAPPPGVAPVPNQAHVPNPPMAPVPAVPALQASSGVPPQPNQEEMELAMAINASIQSAIIEGVPDVLPIVPVAQSQASPGTNSWATSSSTPSTFNGWGPPSPKKTRKTHTEEASTSTSLNGSKAQNQIQTVSAPSAPPIDNEAFYTGPVQYLSIDSSPINMSTVPSTVNTTTGAGTENSNNKEEVGTCVICLDAPVQGACIPCGHMAGCMGCLREIEEKRGECPICRAKITQVLKLYAV
ncbi:putative E3 ubiquitin-protein ligase XBOS34 [Carex littledalei]|uniref:Putative E3 ubiquitin-protein ligase XBOS34 n=1 Tax=Carex littledalei TaxID=544730 RepID=A0A833R716_9POAL|nr:putative E3 ubiquitin-protein ligase XBOS34 [Carex littledalei]